MTTCYSSDLGPHTVCCDSAFMDLTVKSSEIFVLLISSKRASDLVTLAALQLECPESC
jgi:hypothetical protein